MAKRRADYGVVLFFVYPVHAGSSSKVSRVGVGAQVFSFHFRTAVFHPSVEHSTIFYIVLWPAVVVYHERKRKKEGTCAAGYVNPVYFNHKTVTDRHTNTTSDKDPTSARPACTIMCLMLRRLAIIPILWYS